MPSSVLINPYKFSGGGGGAQFSVRGVDFPGASTGWLERDADLTGNADGRRFFFSFWMDPDNPTASQQIWSTGNNRILLRITSSEVNVIAANSGGTNILNISQTGATSPVQSGWQHWCGNIDMDNVANCWMAKDGTTIGNQVTVHTAGQDIDFTNSDHGIGANPGAGASNFDGGLAELFILYPASPVADTSANKLKFISVLDSTGIPVDLGATGTNPGLGTPIIWLTRRADGSVADFISNNGTGLGFTSKGATGLTDRGVVT
jgi:hypothetical protein